MSADEFAPPDAPVDAEAVDPDHAIPPVLVRVAGISLAVAGLFVLGSAVQKWLFFWTETWVTVLSVAVGLAGALAVVMSPFVFNGRDWGAVLGTGAAWLQLLLAVGWLLFSVTHAVISPIQFIAAGLALLAGLLVPVSVPFAVKASRARRALHRDL